jgi:DNA-binding transcriptional MerR regulator
MKRRAPQREFYSIGEVCELLRVEPHVLRYWETQFDAFSPSRNRAGARVYRPGDLELIALIRRLVHEEGYTLEGARKRLEELKRTGEIRDRSAHALEQSFVDSLREELENLLRLLGTAPGGAC